MGITSNWITNQTSGIILKCTSTIWSSPRFCDLISASKWDQRSTLDIVSSLTFPNASGARGARKELCGVSQLLEMLFRIIWFVWNNFDSCDIYFGQTFILRIYASFIHLWRIGKLGRVVNNVSIFITETYMNKTYDSCSQVISYSYNHKIYSHPVTMKRAAIEFLIYFFLLFLSFPVLHLLMRKKNL